MRMLLALLVTLLAFAPSARAALHDPWDQLLAAYVTEAPDGVNRFDYARLTDSAADRAKLDAYVASLEATPVSTLDRDAQFAFWANLYNAVTIQVVVEKYPVDSIRQIPSRGFPLDPRNRIGPWRTKRVTVEGVRMSLDDIEHGTMRPTFADPRVHYAVNCASIGCPNLATKAWRAETLEADLETAARAFVNHPRGVAVTERGLRVSSIYEWFKVDFGGDDAGVIAHLRAYASPELRARIDANPTIAGNDYDWAINRP